jgi:glycosyltransferase involved in cell wall biosynthesis
MRNRSRKRARLNRTRDSWAGRQVVICNWRDSGHPSAGGAESYCERVAERFHEHGANVTLLTSRYRGSARSSAAPFGRIVRLGGTFSVYPMVLAWLLLHRRQVDAVVDSQNGIPFFSAAVVRRTTPVTLLIHHVHQQQFALYFPRPLAVLGRLLEKQVSTLVYGDRPVCVVSPSSRTEVRRQLGLAGPIFLVPCGQDRATRTGRRDRAVEPRLVYVGRFVRQKRLELLIDALGEVIDSKFATVELHLVGDGEARAELEQLAQRLGVAEHVVFHGKVPDSRRDELLASAWLFVSPSVAEGWGLSAMEAAAHGVPTVSFRVPGLQDVIADGSTGWLVDEEADLGTAIVKALGLLDSPAKAAVYAESCRARVERFSWAAAADRVLGVLSSERDRLSNPSGDRRESSDAATVAVLAWHDVASNVLGRIRRQDQIRIGPGAGAVEVLIVGADEQGAARALDRMGVASGEVDSMRVARSADLIGWDLDAGALTLGLRLGAGHEVVQLAGYLADGRGRPAALRGGLEPGRSGTLGSYHVIEGAPTRLAGGPYPPQLERAADDRTALASEQ